MITPLLLQVLELYFVLSYPKNFYQNLPSSKSLWEKQFWPCPVDRPSRPTWSTVHVCTSVDRPVDREHCQCSLFFPGRPDRPTDRETCSLVGTSVDRPDRPASQRSEIRTLAVDRPGRPTAVRFSDRLPTAIFFWLNFCWVSPQRLFWPL